MTTSTFTAMPILNSFLQFALENELTKQAIIGAAPATPAPGSPQLQSFLDAIPFANDGDVIRAEHFNAIRAALAQLAAALDVDQLSRVVTPTFTPVLVPVAGSATAAWRAGVGYAVGPATGGAAEGWMAVDLPNQTSIDRLTVRARRPKPVTIWTVELRRQDLMSLAEEPICQREIQGDTTAADGSFTATIPIVDGLTPQQRDDRRRIDTTRYRYLIDTEVAGAQQADALEIRSFSVTCTR